MQGYWRLNGKEGIETDGKQDGEVRFNWFIEHLKCFKEEQRTPAQIKSRGIKIKNGLSELGIFMTVRLTFEVFHVVCFFFLNFLLAVWGEPASVTGAADVAGGVQGGAAGRGDAEMPTAAVLCQWEGCLGGQVGRDEVPGCPGTDGVSAPTLKGHELVQKTSGAFIKMMVNMLPSHQMKSCPGLENSSLPVQPIPEAN